MAKKKRHLTLKKRVAKFDHLNTRTETHGDDDVPACDVSISGILITGDELVALTGDDHAYAHLFTKGKKGEPDEPASLFRLCKPLALVDKFKDCAATISRGDVISIEIEEAKIGRIRIEPQTGGLIALSCQIQAAPSADQLAKLYTSQKQAIDVKLVFGVKDEKTKDKQADLPMSGGGPAAGGENEPDDDDEGGAEG